MSFVNFEVLAGIGILLLNIQTLAFHLHDVSSISFLLSYAQRFCHTIKSRAAQAPPGGLYNRGPKGPKWQRAETQSEGRRPGGNLSNTPPHHEVGRARDA